MKNLILLCIAALCFPLVLSAQTLNLKQLTPEMLLKVKLFDEFIGRFNYQESFYQNDINKHFKKEITREQALLMLFDAADKRADSLATGFSEGYLKTRKSFCEEVQKNDILLKKISDLHFAAVSCSVLYRKQKQTMRLVLGREIASDGSSRWQVLGADLSFLDRKQNNDDKFSLPPNDNETSFIKLSSILQNALPMDEVMGKTFERNDLSLLEVCLRHKVFLFQQVDAVKYYFLDVPGWVFTVENFNRNTLNSGWLISDLMKVTESEKNAYLVSLLK